MSPLPDDRILVRGQRRLLGTVRIGGAKNAALPIMAACLLTREPCEIRNVPHIEDIATMADLLRSLGAHVRFPEPHTVVISADMLTSERAPAEFVRRMRASFLVMGPLLARFGRAEADHPGGCDIGIRPVNVDVDGFEAMGAGVACDDAVYRLECGRLQGARMYLDYPSHTGTENVLMAACLAEGETVIHHASMEPEVVDLARFLSALGARIEGAGTSTIVVRGMHELHGTTYTVMPDRLTAGTFAAAGVISHGDVTVEAIVPEHLEPVIFKLRKMGACVDVGEDCLRCALPESKVLNSVDIQALHYPGFPTDLQAVFGALLTQAEGLSTIQERVFENRLAYASELNALGAHIRVEAQTARIYGATPLRGTRVRALDIRSGAAVILAALAAEGESTILDVHHVDRGYEDFVPTLTELGADIRRIGSNPTINPGSPFSGPASGDGRRRMYVSPLRTSVLAPPS
jgi:UDP-N-acetylglucosamine 1-carboxyvinyltransferase